MSPHEHVTEREYDQRYWGLIPDGMVSLIKISSLKKTDVFLQQCCSNLHPRWPVTTGRTNVCVLRAKVFVVILITSNANRWMDERHLHQLSLRSWSVSCQMSVSLSPSRHNPFFLPPLPPLWNNRKEREGLQRAGVKATEVQRDRQIEIDRWEVA